MAEIELHPSNMKDGLRLRYSWKPLFHFLEEERSFSNRGSACPDLMSRPAPMLFLFQDTSLVSSLPLSEHHSTL
jgi:hypothetical protein